MSDAKSLGELLRIRFENRALIERVNANLGSAVGFKYTNGALTDEPAVIIFVPQKLNSRWLSPYQAIPETLQGPNGLTCRTDVIESDPELFELPDDFPLAYMQPDGKPAAVPLGMIWQAPPLSARNVEVLQALHGAADKMYPGSRLFGKTSKGEGYSGTLGCFVRDRDTKMRRNSDEPSRGRSSWKRACLSELQWISGGQGDAASRDDLMSNAFPGSTSRKLTIGWTARISSSCPRWKTRLIHISSA